MHDTMKNSHNRFAILMNYDDIESNDIENIDTENIDDIDRISDLPDELLCHILSFLPTKLAFSTTLLSKRWAPLYRSLTSLYFNDKSVPDHGHGAFFRFCRFVDTVTLSTPLIKSFRLKFHRSNDCININSWIETVKRHPVDNIQIRGWLTPLSPTFFIFSTLVVLKLESVIVVGNFSVDLPSLTTLYLNRVYFNNNKNFYNLLYGCPVLKDLLAAIFYEKENKDVTLDVPFRAIPNVKILTLKIYKSPNIKSYYTDFFVLQNIINLVVSFLDFQRWDDLVEILQNFPKLQILSVYKYWKPDEQLSINWKYPNSVPQCISSHLRSCTIEYNGLKDELQFIKYILENARLLEVMEIDINYYHVNPNPSRHLLDELSSYPRISPQCNISIL